MENVSFSLDWKLTGFASLKPNSSLVFSVDKSSVKFKDLFGNLKYQKLIFLVFLMTFAGVALSS